MDVAIAVKVAAFCRELGDDTLRNLAHEHGLDREFLQARDAVRAGQIGPDLEADLDALHAMVTKAEGQGLYPAPVRQFTPLPGLSGTSGARWWICPRGNCAGRGRVRPGQDPPLCQAIGEPLVPGPLPA